MGFFSEAVTQMGLLFHAVFARREVSCVVGVAGTKSVPLTLIIILAVVSLL